MFDWLSAPRGSVLGAENRPGWCGCPHRARVGAQAICGQPHPRVGPCGSVIKTGPPHVPCSSPHEGLHLAGVGEYG